MITPEFKKEFKELCEKHNVLAAFVIIDSWQNRGDVYLGGHTLTCRSVAAALRLASEVAQHEMLSEQKNATKH